MRHKSQITRRQLLQISAAAYGSALLRSTGLAASDSLKPIIWSGTALGAPAEIKLYIRDEGKAQELLRSVESELRRLEAIFSLYRSDSALSQLNLEGELPNPPLDLIRVLSTAKGISKATAGAFDPTIQPLWALYAEHFAQHRKFGQGPSPEKVAKVLELVDCHAVMLSPDRIAFARPGMGLSLNGIAQGYITDRIADLLRQEGLNHVLVNMGETRGLGTHPTGRPWTVGIGAPDNSGGIIREIEMVDRAVATSAPLGTVFEPNGRFNHLLHPRTGRCASLYQSVTVTAPNATLADAFSTAFAVMAWDDIRDSIGNISGMGVDVLDAHGAWLVAHA